MTTERAHWGTLAWLWDQVPPPLRPPSEDMQLLRASLEQWLDSSGRPAGPPQALILGVTPEYWSLFQSLGAETHALDMSIDMIDALWPGPRSRAVEGNWVEMPFADGSFDWVACDGGLLCLPHPHGQRRVLREAARVLRPGGLCSFRLFTHAEGLGRLEDLESLLLDKRLRNASELRLWLWSVLQENATQGVRLRSVWESLQRRVPGLERTLLHLGWPEHDFQNLRSYSISSHAYHLITEEQARSLFDADELGLEVLSIQHASYRMADRCPLLVARKRPRRS